MIGDNTGDLLGKYLFLVYTKTVDSVEDALWLARQTTGILCYLPPSNSAKNGVPVFASVTSEEITQINEEAVPKNTKRATKFGLAVFKGNGLSF